MVQDVQTVEVVIMTGKDESFKHFVLNQIAGLEAVEARPMFGGFGLYENETFFGIVHTSKLFFKINKTAIGEYRKHKMKPVRPTAKQMLTSYYQVPVEIIENADALREWPLRAVSCHEKNRQA